jgi:hypothetical protein
MLATVMLQLPFDCLLLVFSLRAWRLERSGRETWSGRGAVSRQGANTQRDREMELGEKLGGLGGLLRL